MALQTEQVTRLSETLPLPQLRLPHVFRADLAPDDLVGLADAILDRLVHNAYKISLRGESMRKRQAKLTRTTDNE
jgi:DNA replication protein DnaC